MPNKHVQNAKARSTEGSKPGVEQPLSQTIRGASTSESGRKRGRGRPPGSKNKPKGLISPALQNEIITEMKGMLPPEHFEYIRGVAIEGKPISTKNELSILILLLSRNLYPALVLESLGESEVVEDASEFFEDSPEDSPAKPKTSARKIPVLRKDVTERLKVLQSLLTSYDKIERDEKNADNQQDTILKITAARGIDFSRVVALAGIQPSIVAGNADEVVWESDPVGDLPDQTSERQVLLQGGEQSETDRG